MSRYNIKNDDGENFAYGFDNPLSQYFLQKGRISLVGPLAQTYGDNSNMITALEKAKLLDKLPKNHLDAIYGDYPF